MIPVVQRGSKMTSKHSPIVMEEITGAPELAEARRQRNPLDRISVWFQTRASEI